MTRRHVGVDLSYHPLVMDLSPKLPPGTNYRYHIVGQLSPGHLTLAQVRRKILMHITQNWLELQPPFLLYYTFIVLKRHFSIDARI